jgi:hypothetical protein
MTKKIFDLINIVVENTVNKKLFVCILVRHNGSGIFEISLKALS